MDGMSIVLVVIVVFTALIIAFGLLCWTLVVLFKPRRGGGSDEESKLIQELFDGLQRMEQRVESLETIMLESEQHSRNTKRN